MKTFARSLLAVAVCLLPVSRVAFAQNSAQIKASIAKAADFLRNAIGEGEQTAESALAAYALIAAGDSPNSAEITAIAEGVAKRARSGKYNPAGHGIYGAGVELMLLEAAGAKKYFKEMKAVVDYLEKNQHSSGAWDYVGGAFRGGDTSQCQYAVLGLWAAQRAGVEVNPAVLDKGAEWFLRVQMKDGGFAYHPIEDNRDALHTMAVAASGSLAIVRVILYPNAKDPNQPAPKKPEKKKFGVLESVDLDTVEKPDGTKEENPSDYKPKVASGAMLGGATRAASWVAQRYSVTASPRFNMYYLYSLERMASLLNIQTIAGRDWYREGAAHLIQSQDKQKGSWNEFSGEVPATAFGILFLTRATAKILKKDIPLDPLGAGLLAGGRGLPDDLNKAILKDGKVESTKDLGPIDALLAELEKIETVDVGEAQKAIVEKVTLGDREELIKQKDRLVKLAKHPNVEVKRTALWALGRTEDLKLAKILVDALDESDVDVMVEARNALCVLSRKPLGFGIKESPFDGLPGNLSQAEKDKAVADWRKKLKEKWVAWYHQVRPYEDRDDLSETLFKSR